MYIHNWNIYLKIIFYALLLKEIMLNTKNDMYLCRVLYHSNAAATDPNKSKGWFLAQTQLLIY